MEAAPQTPLAGRTAVVTGASRNVGRGVAEAFAAAGARVALVARDRARLEETADTLRGRGAEVLVQPTDLGDLAQVEAMVASVRDAWGAIDVFAAIAGGGCEYHPIDAMDPAAWDRIFRQNVTTTFHSARAVLPHWRARDAGTFLTCSGGGGYYPVLGKPMAAYACAKAALCRFTDQMTAELWDTGIRFLGLDPGLVWSEDDLARVAEEERASGQEHPQRSRNRPPSAAGELATWLASDASRPLRGRLVSVYDTWWRDPEQVAAVDASISRYRLRRDDL